MNFRGLVPPPMRRLRVLWLYRSAIRTKPFESLRYLLRGRETTNFTYEIDNREELAAALGCALHRPAAEMLSLFDEINHDNELIDALTERLRRRRGRNSVPFLGRRAAWYAAVRTVRPAVAIETGTHDGLGAAVIARALQRNAAEGYPGRLLSFDIDRDSGWLIPDSVRDVVELRRGDIRDTLAEAVANLEIQFFLHDSLHTYDHELFELRTIAARAEQGAVLLSDNCHVTTALKDFAMERGVEFHYASEQPIDHFYPGAGLGVVVLT